MKSVIRNTKVTRKSAVSPMSKTQLVRGATRITLDQYAKTFKDLAHYDKTEQTAR